MKIATLKPGIPMLDTRKANTLQGVPGTWRADRGQSSTARGYTYKWQKASKAFLDKHPLCSCPDCNEGRKRITPATVVDHHIPHRGDMTLFWDRSNWRAMAKPCHDKKTQLETASEQAGA